MLFTDYYAEASCTAGRANFITGEIPLRTGLTTVGQAGADVGMPAQAATHRHRAQGAGLCHRAVRQEPSRRPEQVPADGARLRRVLRLPVPPRRDVGSVLVLVPDRPGLSTTSTARATWSTAGRPTRTTRPRCRAGARSASRRSSTKARWRRSRTCRTCRTCTTCRSEGEIRHDDLRRGAGQGFQRLHGQGQERRQAVLRLAQHDAHARLDVPLARNTRR